MSIASEITRLTNLRNAIRSKLVSLGLVSSSADLDACTDAISGITNRGAWTSTVEPGNRVTIPAGWHDGSGYVEAEDAPEAIEPTMYTCAAEVTTDSSSTIARKGLKITIPTTRIHDEIIIAFTLSDSYIFGGSLSNSPILSFSDGEVTGSPYGYESKLYLTSYNTTTGGSTEETFESGAVVLAQIPANSSSSIQRMYIHIPNDN